MDRLSESQRRILLRFGLPGAGLLLVLLLILVFSGGRSRPTLPTLRGGGPGGPSAFKTRIRQFDLGRLQQMVVLVSSSREIRIEEFKLHGTGKPRRLEKVPAGDFFPRAIMDDPGAVAFSVTVAREDASVDMELPDARWIILYRGSDPRRLHPPETEVRHEDWLLRAKAVVRKNRTCDVEISAVPAVKEPIPIDPARFVLITDTGEVVDPDVRTRNPIRLTYQDIPFAARRLLIQTGFESRKPEYWRLPDPTWNLTKAPTAQEPVAADTKSDAPDLRTLFERRAAVDPVAALKELAKEPTEEAAALARAALPGIIRRDLEIGLRAIRGKRHADAEIPLTRAALLASPYNPELSRELIRLILTGGQPRPPESGCDACGGVGVRTCTLCREGLSIHDCPRCKRKRTLPCILCEASGRVDHFGYRGRVEFRLDHPLLMQYRGRTAKLPAQTLTYHMGPCTGGRFQLRTEAVTKLTQVKTTNTVEQTCERFWLELSRFVFNGKARIRMPDRSNRMVDIAPSSARRFFSGYERCRDGTLACDLCGGKKRVRCTQCGGKGGVRLPCDECEGSGRLPCETCHGYGDNGWLTRLLPSAPALGLQLADPASRLGRWLDARAHRTRWTAQVTRRLEFVRETLHAGAEVTQDLVTLPCGDCGGKGSNCASCWGSGRSEFSLGTSEFERYSEAARLERQLARTKPLPALPSIDLSLAAAPRKGPTPARAPAPGPMVRRDAPRAVAIPSTVEEMLRQADNAHASGIDHLNRSKTTKDNAVWISEARAALDDLRRAQTLYASAQETLDAQGTPVPPELIKKFRVNMQALVMARKQSP